MTVKQLIRELTRPLVPSEARKVKMDCARIMREKQESIIQTALQGAAQDLNQILS